MGGDSSHHLADSLEYWTHNNALEIDVLEHSHETLSFNVTRCRYAELYRALGIPELGASPVTVTMLSLMALIVMPHLCGLKPLCKARPTAIFAIPLPPFKPKTFKS